MSSNLLAAVCGVSLALVSVRANAQSERRSPEQNSADARIATAEHVLARNAYVRAVLSINPSIESARQGWRAALARTRQAGAFDDPMIDVSVAPLSFGSSRARTGYEVGIHQQLPWFGKRSLERDVMIAEAAASASDLEAVRRELAMTALVLYDQYFVAVRSLEINAQHVELLQSLRTAALSQFEAGRGSVQDALQAEAQLTHLEHDAAVLESDRDVVLAQMNELLHRDPDAPLPPPVVELEPRDAPQVQSANQLQQDAIARRPEISSARFHARAQAAKAEAVSRESYPSFTVSTSYSSMWDMPEHRWMVGVGINVPLPNERRAGAIDEAHALRAQYDSEVARLSDMAKTQVYVALRKVRESELVLQLFRTRLLPVAREQADAAQAGFIASQTAFIAVVEAEKNLRSVELDHQLAQAECDRRQAELDRALGRIPGLDVEGDK
jgi:cobalt-zinc-cadmium efflux system outer membrane protein